MLEKPAVWGVEFFPLVPLYLVILVNAASIVKIASGWTSSCGVTPRWPLLCCFDLLSIFWHVAYLRSQLHSLYQRAYG